jgi:uncharacterized membrane protein YdjX (TVP38/TMEM64 family)
MISNTNNARPKSNVPVMVKLAVLTVIIVGIVLAAGHYNLQQMSRDALLWIDKAGPVGPLIFFVLYVVACVFMLPGAILTIGAGAVFGVIHGSLLVSLSSTAGAAAAFLVGRYLARDMVARRVEKNATFRAVDEAVATEGWKIVGLLRLSPVFPFNLLNYTLGLTRVSLSSYVLASWIGMMPGTVMYVYLGSLAGSLAELGVRAGAITRSPVEWGLYIVGLVATIAVTLVITRIARRALGQRMQSMTEPKETPQ